MLLSDLSDDVLGLVSMLLDGFDNCSLWIASDLQLRQRLVNNVITDFYIKYTTVQRHLWPGNFLKRLQKLSRLSVLADRNVNHIPIENIEIYPIPTLRYLKLDFFNSYEVFDRKRLIPPINSSESSDKNCNDLNDLYNGLEHLEIIRPFKTRFPIHFLSCLPQNLKTLSIPDNYIQLEYEDEPNNLFESIQILPRAARTLTSLNLNFESNQQLHLDLDKLSPHLTNLTTNLSINEKSYHLIPKSLKTLNLSKRSYNFRTLSRFLPTGLESLKIIIKDPPTSQMFTHLENLKILSLESKIAIPVTDFITKYPPTIEGLSCTTLDFKTVSSSLFTNCFTTLALNFIYGMNPEFISLLPQSLTDLTMTHRRYIPESFAFFSLLPRNLKSLVTDFNICEKISLLPKSLEKLYLTPATVGNISYFDRLPPKLVSLMTRLILSRSIMKQLPESLTELRIYWAESIDDETAQMLPRGLKRLTSFASDKITDVGAAYLPPSLEMLFLSCNTSMTDDAIERLPRSLTQLILPRNPNFTDECIKHLPPKLTTLHFISATQITSKSCKYLPQFLKILTLKKCNDWDPEMLEASTNELPQLIQDIMLGNEEANETWRKLNIRRNEESFL